MIRIALLESEQRVIQLLLPNFQKEFAAETVVYDSYDHYVKEEGSSIPFSIYISRNHLGEEETAKKLLNDLYDRGLKSKVIVLGEIDQSAFEFASIPSRFRLPELNRLIISVLDISRDELAELKLPDFIPVPLPHFYLMSSVPCDIYIRLERKSEGDKYVKRIHAGDAFDKEAIKRYELNNLKSFYVEKTHRHLFMDALVGQSLGSIEQDIPLEQMIDKIGDAFAITSDLVRESGINAHSAKFIEGTLNVMDEVIGHNPRFASLFSQLIRLQGDISYRHSYLIMLFGHKVLPHLDWVGKDHAKDLIETLFYVSFFHDIFLDSAELVSISSKQELSSASLTDHQKDLILNHANLAATLAQKMPHAPAGIDIIIRQHHGTSNGVGFIENYNASISKLAIAFIVIERFVWRLMNFDKNKDTLISILDSLRDEFTLPSYKHVLETIRNVLTAPQAW